MFKEVCGAELWVRGNAFLSSKFDPLMISIFQRMPIICPRLHMGLNEKNKDLALTWSPISLKIITIKPYPNNFSQTWYY